MGATGCKHGAEVGAWAPSPPGPEEGRGVKSPLYVRLCASGRAFQRWPGACNAGEGGLVRGKGLRLGQGQGQQGAGVRARAGAELRL